jgi:hypothetical protein
MSAAFLVPEVFFEGGGAAKWVAIAAILVMILLVARWPHIVRWFEGITRRR